MQAGGLLTETGLLALMCRESELGAMGLWKAHVGFKRGYCQQHGLQSLKPLHAPLYDNRHSGSRQ
eukprot:1139316-Pelagomonas_calceolata.AAC.2